MRYISTRGRSPAASFSEALFTGLAPDGGLYVPERIPWFSPAGLVRLKNAPYVFMALELIYPFVSQDIQTRDFSKILNNSIKHFSKNLQPLAENSEAVENKIHPVPAPLRILEDNLALLELFHGPTLAFKDFALQLLAGLMQYFLEKDRRKILILGATSGDTGSAAIEAFRHYPDIKIVILHPHNQVTSFQRRQMTATGAENVWNLAVDGSFDDCQRLVKDCFNDRGFIPQGYNLTAVNSINWARIMAQIVYYFSSFFQSGCDFKRKYYFTVPTGNFGNVLAGYYAQSMGLPVEKFIVAVNENDILHRFFSENDYSIREPRKTHSPSMDIQVSSNLERLFYILQQPYKGRPHIINYKTMNINPKSGESMVRMMDKFQKDKSVKVDQTIWKNSRRSFLSAAWNNEQTLSTIKESYEKYGIVIDPHTAVGLGVTQSLRHSGVLENDGYHIVLSTAHPLKFKEAIEAALPGVTVTSPEMDLTVLEGVEKYETLPNSGKELRDYLLTQVLSK